MWSVRNDIENSVMRSISFRFTWNNKNDKRIATALNNAVRTVFSAGTSNFCVQLQCLNQQYAINARFFFRKLSFQQMRRYVLFHYVVLNNNNSEFRTTCRNYLCETIYTRHKLETWMNILEMRTGFINIMVVIWNHYNVNCAYQMHRYVPMWTRRRIIMIQEILNFQHDTAKSCAVATNSIHKIEHKIVY